VTSKSSERENIEKVDKRPHTDLILSVCAILISAVACGASLYQLRMASTLISAQTWPYVTIGWSYQNDQSGISVANDGLGPALLRSVVLKLDGQPQRDVLSALRRIVTGSAGSITVGALVRGSVIRAGNDAHLILVQGAAYDNQMRNAKSRIEVEICYCSILERCWISTLGDMPQQVGRCEDRDSLETPELQADTAVAPSPKQ
jgi:hypothetical protein